MKLSAIAFNLKKNHYDIIQRISENVLYRPIEVIDLKSFTPFFNGNDAVLIFGARGKKYFRKNSNCHQYLELPEITELEKTDDNEGVRERIWEQLLSFKETLDNNQIITAEALLDLSADNILALEASLKAKGLNEWFGRTKKGETVCLSLLPAEEKKNKADIVLTFAELYAIRVAMDVLEVEEIVIGGSSNSSKGANRSNNS